MLATLAITVVLQLGALIPAPEAPERARFDAQVAALSARWYAGLDGADWDLDAPEVRSLADALAAEGLALLDAPPPGVHRATTRALEQLLVEMGGEAVRESALERSDLRPGLIAPLLRWGRPDPELIDAVLSGSPSQRALSALALWSPRAAMPVLRDRMIAAHGQLASAPTSDVAARQLDALCGAALQLPAPQRAQLAATLGGAGAQPPLPFACGFLACLSPASRRRGALGLIASTRRLQPGQRVYVSNLLASRGEAERLVLAVTLRGTPSDEAARRVLLPYLQGPARTRHDAILATTMRELARLAPWIRPGRAMHDAVRSLSRTAGSSSHWLVFARIRWRDPSLIGEAREVLASPGSRAELARRGLRVIGALTPSTPEAARGAIDAIGDALRASRRAPQPSIDEGEAARWVEALAAPRCSDASCVQRVLEGGSDERAAREVSLMGAEGIAALPPTSARLLVRRVMRRGLVGPQRGLLARHPSALAWATLATIEGCPRALRGLREFGGDDSSGDVELAPWRDALVRACRDGDQGPPR